MTSSFGNDKGPVIEEQHGEKFRRKQLCSYLIIIRIILRVVALQQFPLAPLLLQGLAYQLGNLTHLSWFFSPNNKPVEMLREGSTDTVSQLRRMVTFKPEQSLFRLESTMTHVLLVAKRRQVYSAR